MNTIPQRLLERYGIDKVMSQVNPTTLEPTVFIYFTDGKEYVVNDEPDAALREAINQHNAYLFMKRPKHASYYHRQT